MYVCFSGMKYDAMQPLSITNIRMLLLFPSYELESKLRRCHSSYGDSIIHREQTTNPRSLHLTHMPTLHLHKSCCNISAVLVVLKRSNGTVTLICFVSEIWCSEKELHDNKRLKKDT